MFYLSKTLANMQMIEEHIITQSEEEITLYPELCLEWDVFVNELEFE